MKLVFEFTKTGSMIYISHLDLMRLFLRVLRMAGLRPVYSHGFNPHPKMSFAAPLSLGILSVCELLEFETVRPRSASGQESDTNTLADVNINALVYEVNNRLPEGVRVKAWGEKPGTMNKSLASLVSAVSYEIMCDGIFDAVPKIDTFFAKESITIIKRDKKTGALHEKNVRDQWLDYRIVKDMRGRMLAEVVLSAAPGRTLGPAAIFGAFCTASGLEADTLSPIITRTAILGADGKTIAEHLDLRRF